MPNEPKVRLVTTNKINGEQYINDRFTRKELEQWLAFQDENDILSYEIVNID